MSECLYGHDWELDHTGNETIYRCTSCNMAINENPHCYHRYCIGSDELGTVCGCECHV